jgi:DNA invertase Pin-like site-specific DNA recombinase
MIYGYARVSTVEQNLGYQIERLEAYGCDEVITDKKTGINANRPGLQKILSQLQSGDVVVTLRIDRIARNVSDVLRIIATIEERGASLIILDMGGNCVDTQTPMGKFMVTMLGAVAQFEYDVNRAKQREGIELAKRQGKYRGGVKKYGDNHEGMKHALELYKQGETVAKICKITGIGRSSLYRRLQELGITREA